MGDFYTKVMGQPTITRTAAAHASSGNNTLVAAPSESAVATTAIVKHGSTEFARTAVPQYGYIERDYCFYPVELPEATALVLNLSGANSHGTIVEYVVAPV
jgi:GTP:adenosylcobinamide-phosphate guanylyltransferase